MQRFTRLFRELDRATATRAKLDALVRYFRTAPPPDAAWAVWLFSGQRIRRPVTGRALRALVAGESGLPLWLVEESYHAVGDLAETVALLLPDGAGAADMSLRDLVETRTLPLAAMTPTRRAESIRATWRTLDREQRLVWHKIMLGAFRVGVARRNVVRALSEVSGVEPAAIALRLSGAWSPTVSAYTRLIAPDDEDDETRPYPFCLAASVAGPAETLGDPAEWQVEWKYDGVRAQLVRRADSVFIWSRGEELVTETYPEIAAAGAGLPPGTVLDGEVVAWSGDGPLAFSALQRRIGRRRVEQSFWPDVDVVFIAFDVLEHRGVDVRGRACAERRAVLARLVESGDHALRLAPVLDGETWDELAARRESARERRVEGLMLKRRASEYSAGRAGTGWLKWKLDPHSIDAVLIAAERGHGRRAGLYTDFTFGVWEGGELVPVARAYSGLTDGEFREVNRFIRRATLARHGPARTVRPELVFEIGFEGVQPSSRHKAGVALRFPRMLRWRRDKGPEEADALDALRDLLRAGEAVDS